MTLARFTCLNKRKFATSLSIIHPVGSTISSICFLAMIEKRWQTGELGTVLYLPKLPSYPAGGRTQKARCATARTLARKYLVTLPLVAQC